MRVIGRPRVVHLGWDRWTRMEVMPGDTALFARGTAEDEPVPRDVPDLRE